VDSQDLCSSDRRLHFTSAGAAYGSSHVQQLLARNQTVLYASGISETNHPPHPHNPPFTNLFGKSNPSPHTTYPTNPCQEPFQHQESARPVTGRSLHSHRFRNQPKAFGPVVGRELTGRTGRECGVVSRTHGIVDALLKPRTLHNYPESLETSEIRRRKLLPPYNLPSLPELRSIFSLHSIIM
jgi:hypothetical protein